MLAKQAGEERAWCALRNAPGTPEAGNGRRCMLAKQGGEERAWCALRKAPGTPEAGNGRRCVLDKQAGEERAWCALRNAPDSAVSCAVMSASGGDSARSASALRNST